MKFLMTWFRNYKRLVALRKIRESFAFFGYDLNDYTDEEIEKWIIRMGQCWGCFGISVERAAHKLREFMLSLKKEQNNEEELDLLDINYPASCGHC